MISHDQKMIQRVELIATRARDELIQRIGVRMNKLGVHAECSNEALPSNASTSSFSGIEALALEESRIGRNKLIRKVAYIWFLRLVAIRYMEINDYLPHHVRMLSSRDGAFEPECLSQAMDMPFKALNIATVSRLVQRGDDEATLRELLLAQCDELYRGLPYLFGKYDSAYNLLFPDGLYSDEGFLHHLVCDIPEDMWLQGTDILSYLFEGYAESRKSQVRGKDTVDFRIAGEDLAVLSQTCTAGWMGHLLVDNTLGRVLPSEECNTSSSYKYLLPYRDGKHRSLGELEGLSVMDYACGSGTLLSYAFDAFMEAYTASGYTSRDAVRAVLECNLHGIEVSERASLHAMLALSMKACAYDRRFLRRGIVPNIVLLESIELTPNETKRCKQLCKHTDLIDSLANLDECGSLLMPGEHDLDLINTQIEAVERGAKEGEVELLEKLRLARATLGVLARKHDVVLMDPPKTGAKKISRWFARWIVKHYPNDRSFLPACYIDRAVDSLAPGGSAAVLSTSALLFSGMGSAFRETLLKRVGLSCIVESTDSYGQRWSSETAWFFGGSQVAGEVACIRLNQHPLLKDEALMRVVSGEGEDALFVRNQEFFLDIPGCPIAYWAPVSMVAPLKNAERISRYARFRTGMHTGNKKRFLREWYELSLFDRGWEYHPYANGGLLRKWYGNLDQVIRWANDGEELKQSYSASSLHVSSHFKPGIVWGGGMGFRLLDSDEFMIGSYGIITADGRVRDYLLGLLNSSVFRLMYRAVNSDNNCTGGEIGQSPAIVDANHKAQIEHLVQANVAIAATDDAASETSWEFAHHPLCG